MHLLAGLGTNHSHQSSINAQSTPHFAPSFGPSQQQHPAPMNAFLVGPDLKKGYKLVS